MDQKQSTAPQKDRSHPRKHTPVLDPKNPASKPHATTSDQEANMESEGQAQQPGQEPPAEVVDELARVPRTKK